MQKVRDIGRYPKESKRDGVERQLAEKLRRARKAMQFSPEQEPEHQALQRADSGASQLAVAAQAGEASGEEASGERRGADAQEDGRWHHIRPVVKQAEAEGCGKGQRGNVGVSSSSS